MSFANAVGGRTARACDSCVSRRARWYCAADDAFLCQPCDSIVHSANTLASRHHRLRLNTASNLTPPPSWPRKPRTPRTQKQLPPGPKPGPVVPDMDDNTIDEEQLIFDVPVLDPLLNEFSTSYINETKLNVPSIDGLSNIYPSTGLELDEFDAADMESLLGTDFDEEQFCIGALGLVDAKEEDVGCCGLMDGGVKLEFDSGQSIDEVKMEFERETLDIDFDYESPGEEKSVLRRLGLKLDGEGVIAAWAGYGCSPWIDGQRPEISLDNWWPDYTGTMRAGGEPAAMYSEAGHALASNVGREAKVSRYREKRRTRLFSKKIRYEVRKLNAEKRPRMKGRFVKRSLFPPTGGGAGFPY